MYNIGSTLQERRHEENAGQVSKALKSEMLISAFLKPVNNENIENKEVQSQPVLNLKKCFG